MPFQGSFDTTSEGDEAPVVQTDARARSSGSARSRDERHARRNSGRDYPRGCICHEKIVSVFWKCVAPSWGIPTQLFFSRRARSGNADTSSSQQRTFREELRSVFLTESHLPRKTCVGMLPARRALVRNTDTAFFNKCFASAKYRHNF